MTHAADSAARQAPHGESARGEALGEFEQSPPGTSSHLPVFAAFVELGLTGRDVAAFADVTPPTVTKWRKGKVRIPGETLAFLTLVLAHLIDEALGAPRTDGAWQGHISAARAYLAYQDVLNRDIPVGDVREAAQRFRVWWASAAARRLEEKRIGIVKRAGL